MAWGWSKDRWEDYIFNKIGQPTADAIIYKAKDKVVAKIWDENKEKFKTIAKEKENVNNVIQKVINYIKEGGKIFIAKNKYYYTTPLILQDSHHIVFEFNNSIFQPKADSEFVIFKNCWNIVFNDINIEDLDQLTTKPAIILDCCSNSEFNNVLVYKYGKGIILQSTVNQGNHTRENTLNNIRIYDMRGRGIEIQKEVHDNLFIHIQVINCNNEGIIFDSTLGGFSGEFTIGGNIIQGARIINTNIGIYILNWHELWLSNIIVDGCQNHGIVVENTENAPIERNRIFLANIWSSTNKGFGVYIKGVASKPVTDIFIEGYAWDNSKGLVAEYLYDSFINLTSYKNNSDGIQLINSNNNIIIAKCINNSQVETDRHGIVLEDSSYNLIKCIAYDDQQNKTQAFGVFEAQTSDYNIILHSFIGDHKIGKVNLVGNNSKVVYTLGYQASNSGTVYITGDGTTTQFTIDIPHSLVKDTVVAKITLDREGSVDKIFLIDTDGDGFKETIRVQITYANPPADGESVPIYWSAEIV